MAAVDTDDEPFDEAAAQDDVFGTPPVPSWQQPRSRQSQTIGGWVIDSEGINSSSAQYRAGDGMHIMMGVLIDEVHVINIYTIYRYHELPIMDGYQLAHPCLTLFNRWPSITDACSLKKRQEDSRGSLGQVQAG